MSEEREDPTVNIVVSARGVKVVQFCGQGWQDEDEASRIYDRIKPLIQQMDCLLKSPQTPAQNLVQ